MAEAPPAEADGDGYSLERFDLHDDANSPSAWRRSSTRQGSPGLVPAPDTMPIVMLSEIYAASSRENVEETDWIEFQNTTETRSLHFASQPKCELEMIVD